MKWCRFAAQEPSGYGAAVGQAGARSAAPSPPAMPLTGAALRTAQRAARSGAAQGQRSAPGILFGSLGGPGFGAESPIPGREKEYQAFKDQASNQYAGGAAYTAPPIDAERRNRSPGISSNFYDVAQADFKRPYGMGAGATLGAPEAPPAGQAPAEFGAESPMPGREEEYKAFKDRQASNPIAGRAASPPPPIDADRKKRSPGISNNFYDRSQADFKRPFGT